jgi:hypothetical protein
MYCLSNTRDGNGHSCCISASQTVTDGVGEAVCGLFPSFEKIKFPIGVVAESSIAVAGDCALSAGSINAAYSMFKFSKVV